jgi:hypothetical protein
MPKPLLPTITLVGWSVLGAFAWAATAAPAVPDALQVPTGEKLILKTHATGFQVYTCKQGSDGTLQWSLKTPEADLHDAKGAVIGHHFAGPTWKHKDGSQVSGKAAAHVDAPEADAIPWLLVTATDHAGVGIFANVSSIQRLHTKGGKAPAASQCDASKSGEESKVSYSADYYFYAPAK